MDIFEVFCWNYSKKADEVIILYIFTVYLGNFCSEKADVEIEIELNSVVTILA